MYRKIVAFVPCHGLYYAGCVFSRLANAHDLFAWFYVPYNKCMLMSAELSDWANLGVWTRVNPNRQD